LTTALSNGDYSANSADKRVVQLWSLATFAYSVGFASKWLVGGDECTWDGVSCIDGNTASGISLDSRGLTGQLPPELSLLTGLQTLVVSSNSLSGPIPSSFGSLSKLRKFKMQRNQFTGQIPSSIGGMSSLVLWNLSRNNGISGQFPAAVTQLQKLADLEFFYTNITGALPSGVCNLPSLKTLILNCHLVQSTCWTQCIYPA
jgi:hypothetical protein